MLWQKKKKKKSFSGNVENIHFDMHTRGTVKQPLVWTFISWFETLMLVYLTMFFSRACKRWVSGEDIFCIALCCVSCDWSNFYFCSYWTEKKIRKLLVWEVTKGEQVLNLRFWPVHPGVTWCDISWLHIDCPTVSGTNCGMGLGPFTVNAILGCFPILL